ncbi:TolC family protein [Legionella lytica]|uniref:TolC family protein n=1 Tax=Legionella lytica TaxID=96232 RepID=A0ABY4Y6T5_9GAMM|nr:TolC family protein [Legionella lytica]USQ13264.1 TolC family protein [Legionella lytica]
MIKKTLFLISILIGLWGCGKGVKQQVVAPTQFPSSTKAYKPLDNLPCLAWWQQFHDEELNHLIESGLRYNMDIHIALGNLQQARGELLQVKLSWIPTIQLLAGYSTNPALGVPGGFYGIWPYYVLNMMKLYTQGKEARYNVEFHRAAVEGARLAVIGQIASAYFTLMSQQEQIRLLHQLNKDLKTLITLSEHDIKIGLDNDIALAQLQSDERLIAAQIEPALHNMVYSENALRFLINENPGRIKNKNNFAKLDFSHVKPGSLPATVLNNRPDMHMAIYALKGARASEWVAWSDFFPALQLDDLVGRIHLPGGVSANVTDAYADWDLMPSSLGKVARSKGAQQAKLAELYKTAKRILREVDTDYSANKRMNEQFNAYMLAEREYLHKYKLQQGLLRTGLISYKELLQSKIYLDNLALRTNQAKLELAMSLVVLYQDLAGGYAITPSAEK